MDTTSASSNLKAKQKLMLFPSVFINYHEHFLYSICNIFWCFRVKQLLINARMLLAFILAYLQKHKQHAVLNEEMPQCLKNATPLVKLYHV